MNKQLQSFVDVFLHGKEITQETGPAGAYVVTALTGTYNA